MELTISLATALTLGTALVAVSVAAGGWMAWVSRRNKLEEKLEKRLRELETQGNLTTAETLRWLERTVERHESYFNMWMQSEWQDTGVIRLPQHRGGTDGWRGDDEEGDSR